MPTVIDELVTLLGMEISPRTNPIVQKFNSMITTVSTNVGFLSAGIVAVTGGVLVFAEQANRSVRELDKFNKLTGIGIDSVQELSFATEQAGGNAKNLESDLLGLTKSMSSPIPGEFNNALFMLGVNVKKSNGEIKKADELLLDIADKFQGMQRQEQIQWGSKIGLSTDTILLLQKGREGIETLRKQARDLPIIISEQQTKDAHEFIKQVDILQRVLGFLGNFVASSISPALKEMTEGFVDWITKNREFIQLGLKDIVEGILEGFNKFVGILGEVKNKFEEVFPWIGDFVESMEGLGSISGTVMMALSIFTVTIGALFGKFLLLSGAIVAAGILFDDFITYAKGGDSVLGDLMDTIKDLWAQFNEKFPAIGGILESVGSIFENIGNIIVDNFVKSLELAWEGIKILGGGLGWLMGKFNSLLSSFGLDKFFEDIEAAVDKVEKEKDVGKSINKKIQEAKSFDPKTFSLPSVTKALRPEVSNLYTTQQNISNQESKQVTKNENSFQATFHVQGNNAKEIAEEVSKDLGNFLSRTFPGDLAPVTQ